MSVINSGPKRKNYSAHSSYSYSGIGPKECALKVGVAETVPLILRTTLPWQFPSSPFSSCYSSLFSLTLKTKDSKQDRQLKKLKARKRIYERGRVKFTEIWLAMISDSQCALEWFSASWSFRAILWKPVISLCSSSYTKVSRSAINLKIARFCMADELNGQALPVHHTKPYKNYNFQNDGTSWYFGLWLWKLVYLLDVVCSFQ